MSKFPRVTYRMDRDSEGPGQHLSPVTFLSSFLLSQYSSSILILPAQVSALSVTHSSSGHTALLSYRLWHSSKIRATR